MGEIKGIYYVLSWIVALVGWIVVNQQNNRREERKEIRSALSEIYKIVEDLTDKASKYHQTESPSSTDAAAIKLQLQRLGQKITHLHFHDDTVNRSVYELRSAITYENFDSHSHTAVNETSDLVNDIYFQAEQLIDALEGCFGRSYRMGMKVRLIEEIRRFRESIRV